MLTILFDGFAYGILLFVLTVGLSVTMGLMNFINLAHGAFAMAGGYLTVMMMRYWGVPFLICLPISFILVAALGALAERGLYRFMYRKTHLDQVLFTIGLIFVATASVDYFMGAGQQNIILPDWLRGRTELGDGFWHIGIGHYRLFIVVISLALVFILQYLLRHTRFGSRLRASVDDQRVASGLGINVNTLFLSAFAFGSGLAGLGGALGAEIMGLDPSFPLKFLVYFLIVVAIGGANTFTGPLVAALLVGVADVAGKYYLPDFGAFVIYVVMIVFLLWRPYGLLTRESGEL